MELVEAVEAIEAAEVVRPGKSLLRTSKSSRFLNSMISGQISLYFDVLKKKIDRIMKTHFEFFCRRLLRPAYISILKNG